MQINDFLEHKEQCRVAYSSPSVCVFHFRFEGVMCLSGVDVPDAPDAGYDDNNDLGDI